MKKAITGFGACIVSGVLKDNNRNVLGMNWAIVRPFVFGWKHLIYELGFYGVDPDCAQHAEEISTAEEENIEGKRSGYGH